MPFRATIENAEVRKNTSIETRNGGMLSKLSCVTWNPTGKGKKPLEIPFQVTVFNPSDDILALVNGDKINILADGQRMPLVKIDSNPNIVQIRKSDVGKAGAKTYDSRFVEVTCGPEMITVIEKKDKTRTNSSEGRMPTGALTDFDDDLF